MIFASTAGEADPKDGGTLSACYQTFGQLHRGVEGREYRSVRTQRYTYVRDLSRPWLFYDNKKGSYQLENLIGRPETFILEKQMN